MGQKPRARLRKQWASESNFLHDSGKNRTKAGGLSDPSRRGNGSCVANRIACSVDDHLFLHLDWKPRLLPGMSEIH